MRRPADAAAEAERVVAWLRLPAIGLMALSESLTHPNPEASAFRIALGLFTLWSIGVLVYVHARPAGERAALVVTLVDIAAISVVAVVTGGAFSHARLAFFVVPVAVAFRFRPSMTLAATVVTTGAYVIQAVSHPALKEPEAQRFIATQAGFLAWIGLACVFLSAMLARRTGETRLLAASRAQLLADALDAEQRERRVLAEALHDHAVQNLLSARHELDEAGESFRHPALTRADEAVSETLTQLREAVFELHPYVLDEAGLKAALRSVAQHAATRAQLALDLDLAYDGAHVREPLLFSAARELLSNVVRHAAATRLRVGLRESTRDIELVVEDDGRGFDTEALAARLAEGHIGLASQRVRVEAAGGTLDVESALGRGTRVAVRLPAG